MSILHPDTEGSEAAEGSRWHELVKDLIEADVYHDFRIEVDDPKISSEGEEAARMVADDVAEILERHPLSSNDVVFGTEVKLAIPSIHEHCFGTVDCFVYDAYTRELFIWDFKYGRGVVEVFENWQLLCYYQGLADELPINGHDDQRITVRFRIIQPRAFHDDGPIREWTIPAWELRPYAATLKANAEIAIGSDAKTRSGSHCRYCPARHCCKSALDAGLEFYEMANRPTPLDFSPEALGAQLTIVQRAHEQLGYIRTGLEEQASSLIRSGVNVPGFRLKHGVGHETWKESMEKIKTLGTLFGVDLDKHQPITPNQARKLGVDAGQVKLYTEKPHRGIKLVADDGTRAREIFSRKEPKTWQRTS